MIQVVSSVGLKAALEKMRIDECRFTFGTGAALMRELDAGLQCDVAILFPEMLEDMARGGRIAAGSVRAVARSCLGMGVRTGAPKPDIGSVESLRATLRAAKSIAYSKEGKSGVLMAALVERLGLTEELASKTLRETRAGGAAFNLAEGRAQLAFTIAAEIVPVPGAELAGFLPAEVQQCVTFAAGVAPGAGAQAAALVERLRSPAAAAAYQSCGLELP